MTEITAPAGFFWDNAVSPTTATDLITAVEEANANLDGAIAAEASATASATAAASSAMSAAGAQTAAATSETNAANSATAAAGSVTAAATSATAAASSATSAASSATSATTQASNALSSANAAASSATAAANSATNAATSATAAAASATTASNAAATIPAPSVGTATNYLRVNSSGNAYEKRTVAQAAADLGALHDVGRNKLHNGLFRVAQRGSGPFTSAGYTLDRWLLALTTDTASITQQVLTDADRTAIGDESATSSLQNVFTGTSGASALTAVSQRVESVRRLAAKTVTVSFYAKAASGTPKVGVSIDQVFGTGGSPSAAVNGSGTAVTISSSWVRYSVQLSVPSISGKTLGANGDDFSSVNLWFSSGSTNATRAGSVGVQSGTIQIWGAQLEVGTIVTPVEAPDLRAEVSTCQRFYTLLVGVQVATCANAAATFTGACVVHPTLMRTTPSAVVSGASFANSNSAGASPQSNQITLTTLTALAAGNAWASFNLALSADL